MLSVWTFQKIARNTQVNTSTQKCFLRDGLHLVEQTPRQTTKPPEIQKHDSQDKFGKFIKQKLSIVLKI